MFNCPQNSNLLAPAITKLWGNLMKAIFCRNVNFQSILMCSQTFLQHFATTLYLTAGVPLSGQNGTGSLTNTAQELQNYNRVTESQ
jgi:hypothetical protein